MVAFMFLFVIIGLALIAAAFPILRVARRVHANIVGFNARCRPASGRVVDFDTVDERRFPIVAYVPEGGEEVRVAATALAARDVAMGDAFELLYDPDALGDVSFEGYRDGRSLVKPLWLIGIALIGVGLACIVFGLFYSLS